MSRWGNDWRNYVPPDQPKRQKFGNVKTRGFDSNDEARRYTELKARLLAGEITDLECQPEYVLHSRTPEGELMKVGRVKLDFRYRERYEIDSLGAHKWTTRVEDVKGGKGRKGTRTEAYALRKRQVEAEYNITVIEISYAR